MLLARLAYRNLLRRPRRTMLTVSAMAASTTLLILFLGLQEGMIWDLIESATEMFHGHVSITAEGYRERGLMQLTLDEDEIPAPLKSSPEVKGYAGRVYGSALLSCGRGEDARTYPAQLVGIDPEEEAGVTRMSGAVSEGSFLEESDTDEVVLGKGLTERLGAEVGGEVVLMGQAADGSIAAGVLRVAGILDTGDAFRDTAMALMGREELQKLLALEGRLHEWVVSLTRVGEAGEWASREAGAGGCEIRSWLQLLPQLGQVLDMIAVSHVFMGIIFYFAAVLVTANTMYMSLIERLREFSIMSAIGLKPSRLAVLIVIEGTFLGLVSAVVGGGAGILASQWFAVHPVDLSGVLGQMTMAGATMQPRLRSLPTVVNTTWPVLATVVICVLVSLWPAMKVWRLRPAEVLREV